MIHELNITQIGLFLDILGFVVVFFFGGFSFGIDIVVLKKESWVVFAAKVLGSVLVICGFILQIIGAA
jgi:hypothetical protein